jgi:acetoin utilization transport system permease protein
MWVKALALREIRQARGMIWLLPIVHFLTLGMSRMNTWFMGEQYWIDERVIRTKTMLEAYDYGSYESSSRIMLVLMLFLLALIQLGAERRNGVQEQLFSMPYSRRQIFATKWLVGVGLLTGSLLLNTVIDMIVMASSPISNFFSLAFHINEFLYSMLAVTALYTLALFIGAISGSFASQAVFSFMVFILPIGIWLLIDSFMNVHNIRLGNGYHYSFGNKYATYVDYLNISNYLTPPYDFISLKHVIVLGVLVLVTAWGGIKAYEKNRTENNGKLLIFGFWERVLEIGFVVCFALLSAAFISAMFGNNGLPSYYIGLIIGFCLGAFLIRRLTRIRLKI